MCISNRGLAVNHEEDILHTEQYDSFQFGDAIFSQKKLGELIDTVLSNH